MLERGFEVISEEFFMSYKLGRRVVWVRISRDFAGKVLTRPETPRIGLSRAEEAPELGMAGSGRVGVRAVGGGFVLFVGRLAYNAVSAVGSIVIARLLGPANYGIISIALIYPLMFSGLGDLGLSTAIMRYASIGDFRRAFTALWLRVLITTAFAVALIPLAPTWRLLYIGLT